MSDELTITVVHETLPKRTNLYSLENGSLATRHCPGVRGVTNSYRARNGSVSQYISSKFKRKRISDGNRDYYHLADKKAKLGVSGSVSVSNNNNIAYANCVKGLVPSRNSDKCDIGKVINRQYPEVDRAVRNSSSEDDLSDDTSKGKHEQKIDNDDREGEEQEEEESDEEEEEDVDVEKLDDVKNDSEKVKIENEEESSDDDSSSDSDDEDTSSDEDSKSEAQSLPDGEQEHKIKTEENGDENEERIEEDEEEEEEEEEAKSGM